MRPVSLKMASGLTYGKPDAILFADYPFYFGTHQSEPEETQRM